MTDLDTRRRTGAWWQRELLGLYFPAVGLSSDVEMATDARDLREGERAQRSDPGEHG